MKFKNSPGVVSITITDFQNWLWSTKVCVLSEIVACNKRLNCWQTGLVWLNHQEIEFSSRFITEWTFSHNCKLKSDEKETRRKGIPLQSIFRTVWDFILSPVFTWHRGHLLYLDEINSWGERILFFVSPELKTTNFRHVSDYIERKKKKLALERKTMNLLSWSCQVNRAPARSLKENGFREKLQGRFHHGAGCVGNIDERLINQHT